MVIIIGAGISGLCVAHELQQRGIPYQLLEQASRPGGYIRTLHLAPYQIEQGPNSYLLSKEQQEWLVSLGLGEEVMPAAPVSSNRFIWRNGQYRPLPQKPMSLLAGGFFSWGTKRRVLADLFAKPGQQVAEQETLADFMAQRFGNEVVDYVLDPFVSGIYAGDSHKLLVHQSFPALVDIVKTHGSLLKGMAKSGAGGRRQSLSFKKGMEVLPLRLAEGLKHLHLNKQVTSLTWDPTSKHWLVSTESEAGIQKLLADELVVCTPAFALAPLLKAEFPAVAQALGNIEYPPMAAIHLAWPATALTRKYSGFGGLHPFVEGRNTLGNIWTSQVFGDRVPDGNVLITAFVGGVRQADLYKLPDAELLQRVIAEQRKDYGIAESVEPTFQDVQRWPRAIPQYDHHQQAAEKALKRAVLPQFHIAANWLGGISLSDCIRKGRELGQRLA